MTLEMMHDMDGQQHSAEHVPEPEDEKRNPYEHLPDGELEDGYRETAISLQELALQISALTALHTELLHKKIQMSEVMRRRPINMDEFHRNLHNPATMNPHLFGVDSDLSETLDEAPAIAEVIEVYGVSDVTLSLDALAHYER